MVFQGFDDFPRVDGFPRIDGFPRVDGKVALVCLVSIFLVKYPL